MSVFNAEIKSEKIENTKLEKVSNNFKGQGKSNAFVISPVVSKTTCGNANLTTKINDSKEIKKSNENPPKGKSQLAALLLCIFLGDIGVHRFYLGYPLIGILQILTLGGLGVWTLIDLVFIITGDLKPKNGEYTETLQSLKKKKDNPTQI
ncbi:MAG: TM2 domain-containing protein [Bacteroidetes bacterium]|nr:TM2 domain-containing protein [Bacteroidota bacterium]